MTAGGWMYIGPQGIVHGTFNTLLNAGRLKLNVPENGDLKGKLFVSPILYFVESFANPSTSDKETLVEIIGKTSSIILLVLINSLY